jgi:hypothetical protein
VDGILQASPYVAVLFVVPCNYLTHMVRPTVTPAPLPAARMIRTLRLRSLVRVRLALRSPGFFARVPLNCPRHWAGSISAGAGPPCPECL